jgi:hypothetical protein
MCTEWTSSKERRNWGCHLGLNQVWGGDVRGEEARPFMDSQNCSAFIPWFAKADKEIDHSAGLHTPGWLGEGELLPPYVVINRLIFIAQEAK